MKMVLNDLVSPFLIVSLVVRREATYAASPLICTCVKVFPLTQTEVYCIISSLAGGY